jgi:hypothetical protein
LPVIGQAGSSAAAEPFRPFSEAIASTGRMEEEINLMMLGAASAFF